jgi:hypothetical protein
MVDAYKSKRRKIMWRFALCGAAASLVVFALAFWENHTTESVARQVNAPIQVTALILCPPSIGLMAIDNAPHAMQLVGAFIILLENAALYGFIGMIFGRVRQGSRVDDGHHSPGP